jgi:hypothetical protein
MLRSVAVEWDAIHPRVKIDITMPALHARTEAFSDLPIPHSGLPGSMLRIAGNSKNSRSALSLIDLAAAGPINGRSNSASWSADRKETGSRGDSSGWGS